MRTTDGKESENGIMEDSGKEKSLFGHPQGLYYLFFAELWERFSFYGMRALLTLYMVEKVFVSLAERDSASAVVYASYGSLVYASTVVGGRTADLILGFRRSIFFGGILMSLGHFILAFHRNDNWIFFIALAFIVVGNGFFKPNISSFVGTLYPRGDPRKDSGFTIFYMGINLGAFTAPLLCGWLGKVYGWHYGFGLAGVGMLIGLIVFYSGIKRNVFGESGLKPEKAVVKNKLGRRHSDKMVMALAVLSIPLIALLISQYRSIETGLPLIGETNPVSLLFQFFGIIVLIYLIYQLWLCTHDDRKKLVVALFLTLFMTIFWGFSELSGSIITLFAARNVDMKWINAAQSNAIWPLFVILLSLPFSALWTLLDRKRINPRTPFKFSFGLFFLALAFYSLSLSKYSASDAGMVPMVYLFILYFLITIGELMMSPVGLSKITDLSPKRLMGFMMGVWFLSASYAFQIVGFVGRKLAVSNTGPSNELNSLYTLDLYTSGYGLIGSYALGAFLLVLLLSPVLKRWMGDIH